MSKTPKRIDKAVGLLDNLVDQLHYFYGNNEKAFRKDVLKPAVEIEHVLKELSASKTDTFKMIAKKYEEFFKQKQIEQLQKSEEEITDSVKNRYNKELK